MVRRKNKTIIYLSCQQLSPIRATLMDLIALSRWVRAHLLWKIYSPKIAVLWKREYALVRWRLSISVPNNQFDFFPSRNQIGGHREPLCPCYRCSVGRETHNNIHPLDVTATHQTYSHFLASGTNLGRAALAGRLYGFPCSLLPSRAFLVLPWYQSTDGCPLDYDLIGCWIDFSFNVILN